MIILCLEYLYFCNKAYTLEVVEGNYKLTVTSKPGKKAKLVVGISTLIGMNFLAALGLLTYLDQQKKVISKNSNTYSKAC